MCCTRTYFFFSNIYAFKGIISKKKICVWPALFLFFATSAAGATNAAAGATNAAASATNAATPAAPAVATVTVAAAVS